MLLDTDHASVPSLNTFKALAISPFAFHLTGSRYIGGATIWSDWDLVTKDTMPVRNFLKDLGFESSQAFVNAQFIGAYDDPDDLTNDGFTNEVWELQEAGVKVQVQLTDTVHAKLYARDTIKDHHFFTHYVADTKSRIKLWHRLCSEFSEPTLPTKPLEFGSPEYMQLLFQ